MKRLGFRLAPTTSVSEFQSVDGDMACTLKLARVDRVVKGALVAVRYGTVMVCKMTITTPPTPPYHTDVTVIRYL